MPDTIADVTNFFITASSFVTSYDIYHFNLCHRFIY